MNNFFTHDSAIKAVRVLHPELVHGVDYYAVMGINEDGTPASDAWIERWKSTTVQQPAIDTLKAAVAGMNMATLPMFAPPPPAPDVSTMPLAFFERFTAAEQLAIVTATMQSPQIKLWYDKLIAATEVVYSDQRVAAGLNALVASGLLTADRSHAILPLAVRSSVVTSL